MIRDAAHADIPLLANLIRRSFQDVADRFGLTPANCPSHPSFITEASILEGFQRGGWFWIAQQDTR